MLPEFDAPKPVYVLVGRELFYEQDTLRWDILRQIAERTGLPFRYTFAGLFHDMEAFQQLSYYGARLGGSVLLPDLANVSSVDTPVVLSTAKVASDAHELHFCAAFDQMFHLTPKMRHNLNAEQFADMLEYFSRLTIPFTNQTFEVFINQYN